MKFMKKVLSIVLCFTFIFTVFYFNSSASDKQDFEYTISGDTIKITKCNLKDKEIVIPDIIEGHDVTAVDFMAFARCFDVEKIIIGKNMKSIGDGAFSNCSALSKIIVSIENSSYVVEDDVLFNKDKTEIICYPAQKNSKKYIMPDSVEIIKMLSFSKCAFLEEIELSENLNTISMYSFTGCEKLVSIYMSSKVEKIEQDAINECFKNLLIYFDGSSEQWNNINIDGSSKKQLSKIAVCKDTDENYEIKLTDKDIQLSYLSKVPFELKVSDNKVIKVEGVPKENTSGKHEVTAKITPLKSGESTISAVAENGFVLCKFNYTVAKCTHPSFHFTKTEKAFTCTENGIEIYTCDYCDYTETSTVKAIGHSLGEWEVETKATKDKEGLEVRICNNYNCDYKEERTIPKLQTTEPDNSTGSTTTFLLGDVDGNKKVNASDARKVLRYVAGLEQLNSTQLKAANVDGNKSVTATDARRILRHVAGLEKL